MKFTNEIRIIPADPAGNKTIFVTTPVDRRSYQKVASFLLSLDEFEAEQVAFILADGSMEMCGMEFCGNASRTFALIIAKRQGLTGVHEIEVKVSGCNKPLKVKVDTETNHTGINMPLPLAIFSYQSDTLVDLGGIMHLVTIDKTADPDIFQHLKKSIMNEFRPPAFGVMFYDADSERMTPVVYVADVDSTYFEGSCASGSVAAAAALTKDISDGEYTFNIRQPKGQLSVTIKKRQDSIESVSIEGPVTIGNEITVTLPADLI